MMLSWKQGRNFVDAVDYWLTTDGSIAGVFTLQWTNAGIWDMAEIYKKAFGA